jgi:hypothetical protein
MARDLPANSAPAEAASLVEPLFQTAGIWEIVTESRLALPRAVRSLRAADKAEGWLWAQVRREDDATFTARVVDDAGTIFVEFEGYATVTFEEGRRLPSGS